MKVHSLLKHIPLICVLLLGITLPAQAKNAMHIVINNHLGAPEMLIDENQQVVWQAEYDEFGKATILVEEVEFNHRFPGQYYDKETGLSYNYYRDYDPSLGRYVQSDPIGLAGGINTYGYVNGNPVMYTDPLGLVPNPMEAACVAGPNPVCVAGVVADAITTACLGGGCAAIAGIAIATIMNQENAEDAKDADDGGSCPADGEHSPDRKALNDIINDATNKGRKPLSSSDADTILDWAGEQGIPGVRDDRGTDHWKGGEHIHVPGSGIPHIPVK